MHQALASATRWVVVAIGSGAVLGLLASPEGSAADRIAPLTAVACAALLALVGLELRRPLLRAAPVMVIALVLLVAAVIAPPRTSHDIWSYAMYGRIVSAHHANPYRVLPSAFPHDPALRRVASGWRSTGSVYGPFFTGFSAVLTALTGGSALATRLGYQLLAAGSVAAVLVVLARRGKTLAIAVVALHPLVIVQVVNGGHNDAFVGTVLLGAVLAALRPRPLVVATAAAVAVATKLIAVVPAVVLIAWLWRRHGWRSAATAGLALSGLVGLGYVAAGGGVALRPVLAAAGYVSRASVWRLPAIGGHHGLLRMALLALLVVVPGLLVAAARLDSGVATAAAASLVLYLLAAPYVLPWYFWWAIPLVAVADDVIMTSVLLAITVLVDLAYTWHAVPRPDGLDHALSAEIFATPVIAGIAALGLVMAAAAKLARAPGEGALPVLATDHRPSALGVRLRRR